MSRIGNMPVVIPDKVQVKIEDSEMKVKGPLGEASVKIPKGVSYNLEDNNLTFTRENDHKKNRALHGLTRMLCFNAITGVSTGFERTLVVEGVGFKTEMKGPKLQLNMGFSHPIIFIPPPGISFETPTPTTIKIKGSDKQVVGLVSAKIRAIRPPEPYKGKGIRFEGEYIRRKAGKTAAK